MWQRRIEQTLYDTIAAYFHHGTSGLGDLELYQNEDWGRKNLHRYHQSMANLNDRLGGRRFVCGDNFTIVDITAFCAVYFASLVNIEIPENLKNLERWHQDVLSRPSANA